MTVLTPHCAVCSDTTRIYDSGKKMNVDCICRRARVRLWAAHKAGIGRDYLNATFDMFEPKQEYPNQQKVLEYCRAYSADWVRVRAEGRCLAILGAKASLGKSHLAIAICHDLIDRYWFDVERQNVCMFVNVTEWFLARQNFHDRWPSPPSGSPMWEELNNDEEYRTSRRVQADYEARMRSSELLILDDISRFDVTRARLDRLYAVVNHRTSEGLPMVVTDNEPSWDLIAKKIGGDDGTRIVDRFQRMGETVVIELPIAKKGRKKKS